MKLIGGASMVHFLILERSIKSFHDCAEKKVIFSFTEKHLATAKHADVVWVQHLFDGPKVMTMASSEVGVQQRLPSYGKGKMLKN